MSNVNTDGLPPEMQARIAEIIEKAKVQVDPTSTSLSSNKLSNLLLLSNVHLL